ncbi:MAG: hypothetical protein ABEI99_11690 [Halobaculum sp.]
MKGAGTADVREIDRYDGGVGWLAYPDEKMQRASHAVSHDGEVWVLDPVDAPGVDDLLAELDGDVAGVVVGLDRHKRDAAAVADRHDVPVYVPNWMTGVVAEIDAPVERFGSELTDGVRAIRVRDSSIPPWQEVALLFDSSGTLYVPEALGNAEYMVTNAERLGVHPMLRLTPPRAELAGLDPDHVVVGHGIGVHERASQAVDDALSVSRSNTLSLYGKTVKSLLG